MVTADGAGWRGVDCLPSQVHTGTGVLGGDIGGQLRGRAAAVQRPAALLFGGRLHNTTDLPPAVPSASQEQTLQRLDPVQPTPVATGAAGVAARRLFLLAGSGVRQGVREPLLGVAPPQLVPLVAHPAAPCGEA